MVKAYPYKVEVLVHGKPIREYRDGEDKTWVCGFKGSEFVLRIRNCNHRRAVAVVTVDGLSVMTGKPGKFEDPGYVISGYGYIDIPGWRLDDEKVAKFVFKGVGQSYAASKGDGSETNAGVIGVAVFEEREPVAITTTSYSVPTPYYVPFYVPYYPPVAPTCPSPIGPIWLASNGTYSASNIPTTTNTTTDNCLCNYSANCNIASDSIPSDSLDFNSFAPAPAPKSGSRRREATLPRSLGTGFGGAETNKIQNVIFDRASDTPDAVIEIHYDDKAGLKRRGILRQPAQVAAPQAFPAQVRGCQPPKGWKG